MSAPCSCQLYGASLCLFNLSLYDILQFPQFDEQLVCFQDLDWHSNQSWEESPVTLGSAWITSFLGGEGKG